MFALSELYSSGDCPSVHFFKPWWDLVIDYLNFGIMILTLIAFAKVTLSDQQGLICIGIEKTYSWAQIKYLNSKCSYTFTGRLLVHYPYAIFFQWLLLICIHHGWLLHPAIFSKFDAFYGIFKKMCNITPKYYRNPNTFQMASELSFDSHNQDKIEVLHVKLLYLLTENSYIITVYKVKTIASCIAGMGSTISVLTAIYFARQFPLNFKCDFGTTNIGIELDDVSCNISPAWFLYGLMIANVFVVFCVTLLSLNGIVWMIRRGLFGANDMADIFGSTSEYYGGLPGFKDFQLCILLVQKNIRDGNVMFETVKACIKGQAKKFKRFNYKRRGTVDHGKQMIVQTRDLEESKTFVRWIADQLGLDEAENSQDSNHLFDCIRFVQDGLGVVNFDVCKSMRELIADEIERNPIYFKTLIDKDTDVPDYEAYVKQLRLGTTFGKQYVLMAASCILQVRLVIIHCHPRKKVNEVFMPYKPKYQTNLTEPNSTRFLTFISPHFYHATYNLPVKADWPTILTKRRLYATDSRFRADMRNAAVRCINTLNVSNSTKSMNSDLHADRDDNVTMEMPVMGLKRGRK
eukprot:gene8896-9847_t